MLLIHKISVASSSNTFKYFDSTHLFGFTQESTYTCSVADISYDDGQVLLSGIDALRAAYAVPVLAAKIGLEEFEAAQLVSFSSPAENLIGEIEISFTLREDKKVENDASLSSLSQCIPSPEKLAAISESCEFSRTESGISWSRNVSVQYDNLGDINFLRHAGILVKNLFILGRPSYGFLTDELSAATKFDAGFKPLISESYDLINHSVQFSESFSCADLNSSNTCSVAKSYSLSFEDGFKNKTVTLSVYAVKEPLETNLSASVKTIITQIKNEEEAEFGDPFSIEKTISPESGSADITISFSTDQRKNSVSSEYSVEKQKSGGFFDYSVSRTLRGRGPNLTGWEEVYTSWKAAISAASKVTALFGAATIFEKSRSTTFNRFEGSVQESIVYTDNPEYKDPNSDNILKSSKKVSDEKPVERIYKYGVLGEREKVQRRYEGEDNGKTLGSLKVSVEMIKKKTTDWDSFLDLAFAEITEAPPVSWITSKTASIDVNEGKVNASIEFNYVS